MKCNEIKNTILDYLFEEIDVTARQKMDAHLNECPDCKAELREFQSTVNVMNKWEKIEPKREMVFINPKENLFRKLGRLFSFNSQKYSALRWARRLVLATAILTVLVFRTEIRYSGGQFSLTIGSNEKAELTTLSPQVMSAVNQVQEELYLTRRMVATLYEQYEQNRKMYINGYDQLSKKLAQQRLFDLNYVGENFQHLQNDNRQNFARLDRMINKVSISSPVRK